MGEYFDEQISEFIDDEMSVDECEFFVRRLQRDDEARGRYLRYTLIGAAVRGEHVQRHSSELRRRLEAALAADPVPPLAVGRRRVGNSLIVGAGLAAGVALFAVVGMRMAGIDMLADDERDFLAAISAPNRTLAAPPAGRTEPFAGAPAQVDGIQYVLHHTGYSSSLNRTIMQSSLVAARENDTDDVNGADPLE